MPNQNTTGPPQPRAPQLFSQLAPNLKNNPNQQVYSNEATQYLTYVIEISDAHLHSGNTLVDLASPQITKFSDDELVVDISNNV